MPYAWTRLWSWSNGRTGDNYFLPNDTRAFSRQLAGLNYVRHSSEPIPVFAFRGVIPDQEVIVAANKRPMYVRMETKTLEVFLLGGPSLPNLDERLSREHELKEHYDRLLPVLMFFRHCFGQSSWHDPEPAAQVIIDDPLLRERYGFLDYSVLLKSMQRYKEQPSPSSHGIAGARRGGTRREFSTVRTFRSAFMAAITRTRNLRRRMHCFSAEEQRWP